MSIDEIFGIIIGGQKPDLLQAKTLMDAIVAEEVSDIRLAAILGAIEVRQVTGEEIAGFVSCLKQYMVKVQAHGPVLDTCGTGGSGLDTLNTSTMTALTAATCGAQVAKHGNRASSGKCGSLDVLEYLGVNADISVQQSEELLVSTKFCFLNARNHHPVLAKIAPVRKALKIRTVFNLLGPLLNPAGVKRQLLGVSDKKFGQPLAEALKALGHEKAWVVAGPDGLDEIGLSGPSEIWQVNHDKVVQFRFDPSEIGLKSTPFQSIAGGNIEHNARRFIEIIQGHDQGAAANHVALNAAAALYIADITADLKSGFAAAKDALSSGAVFEVFEKYKNQAMASKGDN